MPKPLAGTVIQVYMADLGAVAQSGWIQRVAMVLSRDVDSPCLEIFDRVIAAMMTELQLVGPGAKTCPSTW